MLIRDTNGNIINIKRSDFISDTDYYKQLSLFYGVNLTSKIDHNLKIRTSKDKILDFIKML